MTGALYCEACDINWPYVLVSYKTCPGCSKTTTIVPGMVSLGADEALQRAVDLALSRDRHAAFAAFCAERDAPMIEAAVADLRAELDKGLPA